MYPHAYVPYPRIFNMLHHRHARADAMVWQQRPSNSLGARSLLLQGTSSPSLAPTQLTPRQADTSKLVENPENFLDKIPDGITPDAAEKFLDALRGKMDAKELKDFYQVGLFSYCEGEKDAQSGKETITYCSARKFQFHFDPLAIWGMNGTNIQEVLGDKYDSGMNAYKKAAGWMNWAFVITIVLTAVEFVIGFFAIFSRWGSLVTTVVSTVRLPFTSNSQFLIY